METKPPPNSARCTIRARAQELRRNLFQRHFQDIYCPIEIGVADDKGRLKADDVAELAADADEHAFLAAAFPDLSRLLAGWCFLFTVGHQFDPDHQTQATDIADERVGAL